MDIKNDDKQLQDAYDEIFEKIIEMIGMKKYDPQIVAATLMAQALRMYKTILTEEDYIKMVESMAEGALDIDDYKDKRILN
jgi:hypothetical protein